MQARVSQILLQNEAERTVYQADLSESASKQPTPHQFNNIAVEEVLILPIALLVIAWGVLILKHLDVWKNLRYKLNSIKCSHQIPCYNCKFYNKNPYLKCAVHPSEALSERAVNCSDYCPQDDQ